MKLPRFTLRDLFWLVLVVALALGWAIGNRSTIARAKKAEHELAQVIAERDKADRWRLHAIQQLELIGCFATVDQNGKMKIAFYSRHDEENNLERGRSRKQMNKKVLP